MNDLLKLALDAHGGLERWEKFSKLTARVNAGGVLWPLKGVPGLLDDYDLEVNTRDQFVSFNRFAGADQRSVYTPDRVSIENASTGETLQSRDNPRQAFHGHVLETQWDQLHLVYFASYAMWLYLNQPFLYTRPGFATEELPPVQENGETWRRLKVTFPESIATHSREQITYFGEDGLLRRHDYTVEVSAGATGANYASGYQEVNGILVPTKRRVYPIGPDGQKAAEPLLVSIDMSRIHLR
ncbi:MULTISPECIES: hypothetical protein [unclassified Paenibacillus]|uniref:hypothetical protein n=1 Tax=unclassified Paenibacillus TaxID=185978 RepID=UPI001044DB9F|nr:MULTISPECIES: hypothetical protein [unclassified Paenibacillus]NIK70457.1 hypothetical protein [Paenibacillus sp. BK720]TCM90954.1 hypothetical protein EV294_10931 [Paenibacillus sp. BK033]